MSFSAIAVNLRLVVFESHYWIRNENMKPCILCQCIKPPVSVRIITICFPLNAWHIFFQELLLLDLSDVWICTFTVATCISSIAFCINVFEYFLQPVATKSVFRWKETHQPRDSVLGAVQRMPLSKKEEAAAKKKDARFVIENLP